MIIDQRFEKAQLLCEQRNFKEAQRLLFSLIADEAENARYLGMLAEVHLNLDELEPALEAINSAIGIDPELPYLHYIKARVIMQKESAKKAIPIINEALELDPYDDDFYALLAHLQLSLKDFEIALETADRALEINPENILALNTRSTALIKLKRIDESQETIEGALREDPDNAYTHANHGWGLLEQGDHKKAMEHFAEALRSDPTFEYAQAGMIEGLKARNLFYRWYLKYAFWSGNLSSKFQWVFIIGFYVGFRFLRKLANNNPTFEPFLNPILIALAVFALSTWIISPIGDLFLRFNKFGIYLLDKHEKMSSNFVAISAGLSIIGFLSYLFNAHNGFLALGFFGLVMMVPCSVLFSTTKNKNVLIYYTIAMAVVGILSITISFLDNILMSGAAFLFILGFVAFQFLANYMIIRENE